MGETRMVVAQAIGFFVLYLPALAALSAGGIGLIRRRRWGYYAHIAGSAFVAVTVFGVVYTIPALAIARRPEFKEYFLGPMKPKPALDSFGEL
jgi:hypothetical protein